MSTHSTPCYCEFQHWPSTNFFGDGPKTNRNGDRCFLHDDFCLEGNGPGLHYVCSLGNHSDYSWSCRPITDDDIREGRVIGLVTFHPGSEGQDHHGPYIGREPKCVGG